MLGVLVGFSPQLLLNVYQKESRAIYVGGGVTMRYALYPTQDLYKNSNKTGPGYGNTVIENYFEMKSFDITAALRAGFSINSKLAVEALYNFPTQLTDTRNNKNSGISENSLQIGATWAF